MGEWRWRMHSRQHAVLQATSARAHLARLEGRIYLRAWRDWGHQRAAERQRGLACRRFARRRAMVPTRPPLRLGPAGGAARLDKRPIRRHVGNYGFITCVMTWQVRCFFQWEAIACVGTWERLRLQLKMET